MNYFGEKRNRPDVTTIPSSFDSQNAWEFKILTSESGAFRKADELRNASEQEAPAGWIFVEKIDDQRLRFKRQIAARSKDIDLEIDPYRSNYDTTLSPMTNLVIRLLIFLVTIIGTAAALYYYLAGWL